jgi:phosphate transport system substrate-binding protein
MNNLRITLVALGAASLAACGGSSGEGTRDSVRAVGSSTVYPFAKLVAENFAKSNPDMGSPIVESTGTGGGIELFCKGVGAQHPDIVNASRRMKASEFEACQANGVTEVTEIQVGLDGIAFASANGGIQMNLTPEIVYRAIAARPFGEEQTAKMWSDVDPSLPNKPILVYGPPSTSGTRDALKELVLIPGCESNAEMKALKDSDEDRH